MAARPSPRTRIRTCAGVAGQVERRLPRRVAAADDVDALAGQRLGLRHRGAVEHARALELGQAGGVEAPVLDPEREHDRTRRDLGAAVGADDVPAVPLLERRRAVREPELRPEEPRLLVRTLGELAAAEATRKAEVVADQRARAGLAADGARVEHGRPQALRGGVHGRAQAGRAGADDDEIGLVRVELRREAERTRQLGRLGIGQHLAVGERHRRLLPVLRGDSPVRNAEPGEAGAKLVRTRRARVGDDGRARGAFAAQALRLLQQLADRPVEDLVPAPRRCDHVEVDPAAGHAAQDELADAAAAPAEPGDQEAAPGGREAAAHPGEQVGSLLSRREGDGDVGPVRLGLVEDALELGGRADPDDVVGAVATLELLRDQAALVRVVVGDHEQRRTVGEVTSAPAQSYDEASRTSSR